jgi:integrase
MSRPPRPCVVCRRNRVAWTDPRVDVCYACLPGGPFTPPPCRRCGSREEYYSAGLCGICHHYAPLRVDSCRHCYAWGVIRKHKWMCWGCVSWRTKHDYGTCGSCGRRVPVEESGFCRLCWRQAAMLQWTRAGLSIPEANRNGQQLFFANLHQTPQRARRGQTQRQQRLAAARLRAVREGVVPPLRLADHEQLVLFEMRRDMHAGIARGFPPPPDPDADRFFHAELGSYGDRHGWSPSTLKRARRGMEILLGLQDTPGARFKTSLIKELAALDGAPSRIIQEFLASLDLVVDDREPAIIAWFAGKVTSLPEQMIRELRVWFEVMWHGHTTSAPRSRARHQNTIRSRLNLALPALHTWAGQGHQSLREITRRDVLDILDARPAEGLSRFMTGSAVHNIFKTLKAHKVIFSDPTLHIRLGSPQSRQPLPADLVVIRDGLASPDPTTAALTALLAFHALRSGQLRALHLTDVRDGRLHLGDRVIPLAEAVRVRLAAYLDYRNTRWPATANPHLFIHLRTALGTGQVGTRWLGLKLGTAAKDIRTDRILDEVRATGGDIRRICDLFGLTVAGAARYTAVLDHPDLRQSKG